MYGYIYIYILLYSLSLYLLPWLGLLSRVLYTCRAPWLALQRYLGAERILAPLFLPTRSLQLGAEAGRVLREHALEKARLRGHRDLTKACPRTVLDTVLSILIRACGGPFRFSSLVKANSTNALMELLAQPVRSPINTVDELRKASWRSDRFFCWEEKETKKIYPWLANSERNRRRNATPCRCGCKFFPSWIALLKAMWNALSCISAFFPLGKIFPIYQLEPPCYLSCMPLWMYVDLIGELPEHAPFANS